MMTIMCCMLPLASMSQAGCEYHAIPGYFTPLSFASYFIYCKFMVFDLYFVNWDLSRFFERKKQVDGKGKTEKSYEVSSTIWEWDFVECTSRNSIEIIETLVG